MKLTHQKYNFLDIRNFSLSVEEVANHQEEGIIGGAQTQICFKNKNNYLIATKGKGWKLIREGETLSSSAIDYRTLRYGFDLYHDKESDAYFISSNGKIYRKKVDKNPPKLFFVINNAQEPLVEFDLGDRIMIFQEDKKSLIFVNKTNKKVEFAGRDEYYWFDVMMFNLSSESQKNKYKRRMRAKEIRYHRDSSGSSSPAPSCDLGPEGEGLNHKLIVNCPKRQLQCYFISEFCWEGGHLSRFSVVKLFDISDKNRSKAYEVIGSVRYDNSSIFDLIFAHCFGYFGDHLLFMVVSGGEGGYALLFDFNTKTGELREVEAARCLNGEVDVQRLHPIDTDLYYTGKLGRVMKLKLSRVTNLEY